MPKPSGAGQNLSSRRNFNTRRVLFDTNILLDALDRRRPESQEACLALKQCNGGGDMGLVTSGSLKDVYYILSKWLGAAEARRSVGYLLDLLVVVPVGGEECLLAMRSNEPDFEDAQVRVAAELNDVRIILTRDEEAFRYSTIRSMTCAEYVEMVRAEGRLR